MSTPTFTVFFKAKSDVIKELEFYQDKQLSCDLYRTKLINWLERQIKKFELFDKKSDNSKSNKNLSVLFKTYSEKILDSLEKVSSAP